MGRGPGVRFVGKDSVQIDFRWRGRRCRERLRLAQTEANERYAKRLKAVIEHEIATGTFDYAKHFPNSERAAVAHGTPLRIALEAYIDSLVGAIQPETEKEYRSDAATFASWYPPDQTIESLTRKDVRRELQKQNLSRSRLNGLLKPVRGTFRQMVEDELIESSPLQDFSIRRVGGTEKEIDPFTPAELHALRTTENGDLWTFWAETGPRSGEVIGLLWGDVSRECDRISIRRAVRRGRTKAPKTKAGVRDLALLPRAREVLLALERGEDADPVFCNPRTGRGWYEAKTLNRAFWRSCKQSGVRYRYVYQLRHTFASLALSSGENPAWAAKRMGHADLATFLRVYAKWMPTVDPTAGSKMAQALESKAHRGQRVA